MGHFNLFDVIGISIVVMFDASYVKISIYSSLLNLKSFVSIYTAFITPVPRFINDALVIVFRVAHTEIKPDGMCS